MALRLPGDDEDVRLSLGQGGVKADPGQQRSQDEAEQGGRTERFVERTPRTSRLGLESGVQLKREEETDRLIIYSKRW